jgi:hypothetical protein
MFDSVVRFMNDALAVKADRHDQPPWRCPAWLSATVITDRYALYNGDCDAR